MQVLSVDPGVVSKVTKTAESYASDVLHVHVSPSDTAFHLPVTVHLALPEQLVSLSNLLNWGSISNATLEVRYIKMTLFFYLPNVLKFCFERKTRGWVCYHQVVDLLNYCFRLSWAVFSNRLMIWEIYFKNGLQHVFAYASKNIRGCFIVG